MATNKNQHFVPRCYFKAFSNSGEGRAINLYNIDRRIFVRNAALKYQCSGSYFYGENERVENAMQFAERTYGSIITSVLTSGYRPSIDDKHFLKLFWLLQYLRTESAAQKQMEMLQGFRSTVKGMPERFVPNIDEAVTLSLNAFAKNMPAVSDLEVCLVSNESAVPFVTSDDPAIMANRWVQLDRRAQGMSFGLTAAGLLALLPLSQKVLFLAYDGGVYDIPNKKGWVRCTRDFDARAFNQFQYYNCRANIFVRDPACEDEVVASFEDALPYRLGQRHKISYAVFDSVQDGYKKFVEVDPSDAGEHTRALVQLQAIFPVPPRWPTQIKWNPRGMVYTNGSRAGYIRKAQIPRKQSHGEFWSEPAKIVGKT